MKQLIILLSVTSLLSCFSPRHLHRSGTYTIKERTGNVTKFHGVKGRYNLVSDTLKKDDKVFIQVIKVNRTKKGMSKNDLVRSL